MSMPINHNTARTPLVLLHDYEYMIRKTFGLFASEVNLATVVETSDISQAKKKLSDQQFDMIILGFDDWLEEIHLIQLVRDEMTYTKKDTPIIAIVPTVTSEQITELKLLNVSEILLKPTRIKTIQQAFANSFKQILT